MKPWAAIFLLFTLSIGCTKNPPLPTQDTTLYYLDYGQLPAPNIPGDNALTNQGVRLGRMLFYGKSIH